MDRRVEAAMREAIEQGGLERIDEVMAAIESTGAIEYTAAAARVEADQAIARLASLPDSSFRDALAALAEFSVNRSH